MARRNDSSLMRGVLQPDVPKTQPERRKEEDNSNSGAEIDKFSSIPDFSSENVSHSKTSSFSGPCFPTSRPPIHDRPCSPNDGPSSPKAGPSYHHRPSSPKAGPSSHYRPSSPKAGPSSHNRPSSPKAGPSSHNRPSSPKDGSSSHNGQAERGKDRSSSCCSLEELKRLPGCHTKLEPLRFSPIHTVLVDVNALRKRELVPQPGRDMWDSNFVRMPCSKSSVIKTKFAIFTDQAVRWESITKHLKHLSKKSSVSVNEVKEAIWSLNPTYKDQWSFDALAEFVRCVPEMDNYYNALFPKIADLALELPNIVKKAIPMLHSGKPALITLSQIQISCLLANAFFCTFPHRNTTNPKAEYSNFPSINFSRLFGDHSTQKSQKLRAIMHYFKVMTDKVNRPRGLVTFERRVLSRSETPDWKRCEEKMPKLHVTSKGSIEEEGRGMLQVDFASKWIGGGVLSSGLVQEEILFLMNPELIVSRLFTEKLEDNECLIITGSQQFSSYFGYRDTFEWSGPHEDYTQRDEWERRQRQILAIDARFYKHSREQYNMSEVIRELNKAYCGFKSYGPDKPDIATGKWGCGAFHGDPHLKAVIQLMAAAKAKRGLAFFTFNDKKLEKELQQLYHLLVTEGTTVDTLFRLVEDFCQVYRSSGGSLQLHLFDFIKTNLTPSKSQL